MAFQRIFSLAPQNQAAWDIFHFPPNAIYQYDTSSGWALAVGIYPSKTPGRLVTIGTHESRDILLPRGTSHNYRRSHCHFFLAPQSGELILRDESRGRTEIGLAGETDEEQRALHKMHGLASDPRQRVIPKSSRNIEVVLGVNSVFRLIWSNHLETLDLPLPAQAQLLAVLGGSVTRPADNTSAAIRYNGPHYDLKSVYAPTVRSRRRPKIEFYRYQTLGKGGFGTVSKVVDLKNGDIWAVKEINPGNQSERWKEAFKKEVEIISQLKHSNIVHFEHFQDFCDGGRFQLFFKLCQGNLEELLAQEHERHNCHSLSPSVPSWAWDFTSQTLDALDYLHSRGIIHRDIKPGNILFNETRMGEFTFYLADFGLSLPMIEATGSSAGTYAYMAPEVFEQTTTAKLSDIWSFGITLGRVLGYWCEREMTMSSTNWLNKLILLGVPDVQQYDEPGSEVPDPRDRFAFQQRWYGRVRACKSVLPDAFFFMLSQLQERCNTYQLRRLQMADFIQRPLDDLELPQVAWEAQNQGIHQTMLNPTEDNGFRFSEFLSVPHN